MTDIEVFSGPSLEEALAAARAAYGPRVKITRAQRVRRGVRGLLGQARYDVHARVPATVATVGVEVSTPTGAAAAGARTVGSSARRATDGAGSPRPARAAEPAARRPGTSAEGRPQGLADVLAGLVDAADESESVRPEPSWWWNGEVEVDTLLSDVVAIGAAARTEHVAQHPAPALAEHRAVPVAAARDTHGDGDALWRNLLVEALQPAAPPAAAPPRAVFPALSALAPETATFDRATLRGIGVPPAVLRRLPVEDPTDEPGWRRALQEAIAAVVPEPAEPDVDHPIVVSGHGLAGAIAVLRAAVEDGAVPGTISFQGRRRQATPAALVEVLAACARS